MYEIYLKLFVNDQCIISVFFNACFLEKIDIIIFFSTLSCYKQREEREKLLYQILKKTSQRLKC